MASNTNTEVLVAGAGPTGLVMAAELVKRGVNCRIIDIERGPTDHSKAIGIQARTLEIFEYMGLAGRFISKGLQMNAANIYDKGKRIVHLSFKDLATSYPFVLLIPQSETENILLQNLEQQGAIVERQTKLLSFTQDDAQVTAEVEHADGSRETIGAKWLIGCDGAHSTVRHQLHIPFDGSDYEEGFQLADVNIEWPLSKAELHVLVYEGWLMAAFPLPGEGNRYRLIVDVEAAKAPLDKVPALEELQAVFDERSHVKGVLSDPRWTANYRIHRRIVPGLHYGRVFLAGDAAHIHSPAAAQGMNTGIQDVFNLAWKLALVVRGHSPESILESYHAERYPVEQGVLKSTNLLLNIVSIHHPLATTIRDVLAPFLTGFGAVKQFIGEKISELAVEYPNSPIIAAHSCHGLYEAGERLPDAPLLSVSPEAAPKSVYALLCAGRHVLLLLAGEETAEPAYTPLQQSAAIAKKIAGTEVITCLVKTVRDEWHPSHCDFVVTEENPDKKSNSPVNVTTLHECYGIKKATVYLIRPDGYIAFCSAADNAAERLQKYLPCIFTAPAQEVGFH